MKKIFMTLMASMLLLSSTTYATESVNHKTHMVQKQSMTKQDMQAVFGTQHVKASSLNQGEMARTDGKWYLWAGMGIAWAATAWWAYNYTHGGGRGY